MSPVRGVGASRPLRPGPRAPCRRLAPQGPHFSIEPPPRLTTGPRSSPQHRATPCTPQSAECDVRRPWKGFHRPAQRSAIAVKRARNNDLRHPPNSRRPLPNCPVRDLVLATREDSVRCNANGLKPGTFRNMPGFDPFRTRIDPHFSPNCPHFHPISAQIFDGLLQPLLMASAMRAHLSEKPRIHRSAAGCRQSPRGGSCRRRCWPPVGRWPAVRCR